MKRRLPARWSWTLLSGWAAALLFVGAVLLGRHVVALPKPERNPITTRAFAALREPGDHGRWLAVHVLYAGCKCSARIVDHLAQAEPNPSVREVVLWVGQDLQSQARLAGAGFRVRGLEPEVLRDRFGVEAAPVLIVLDPQDRARYVGGYTSRKQGPDIQDRKVLAALLGGARPAENPVLGCAVSGRLKTALDPLGLP
jgi:hypothetical protein